MTVTVPRATIRLLVRGARVALFATATVTLCYCGFEVIDAWVYQLRAGSEFDQQQIRLASPHGPGAEITGLMGRMEIPSLGMSVMIAEGTGEATLRRAAGHITDTAMPGNSGNVGIAGHRDTLFRSLKHIRNKDLIKLTTLQGEYQYQVVSTQVVSPSVVSVLNSDGQDILTLVTCYPFYFVGPAPDRFIVRAQRVGTPRIAASTSAKR